MTNSALAPNEDLTTLSLDYQDPLTLGPLALEGGLHTSRDRASLGPGNGTRELTVVEGSVGVRWSPLGSDHPLTPYVGAGGSLLWAEVTGDSGTERVSDDDVTTGGYAKVGLLLHLGRGRHLGLEIRSLSAGSLVFTDGAADADSTEVLLIFGTRL